MRFPRLVVLFLCLSWALVSLYPDPVVIVDSVRNLLTPPIQPEAVATLAARLPDDPRRIEELVLVDVVPYASDWESAGVPWSFPTTAQVLRTGRGDCESRALVVASVLAAKGIPYELRMSFDHIWVDYPGKVPTANENDALVMVGRDGGGWFGLRWPKDIELWRDARAQVDIYWTPMPTGRKALLFVGLAAIACWNALATLASYCVSGRHPAAPTAGDRAEGLRCAVSRRWIILKMTTGRTTKATSMAMRRIRNTDTASHTATSMGSMSCPFLRHDPHNER